MCVHKKTLGCLYTCIVYTSLQIISGCPKKFMHNNNNKKIMLITPHAHAQRGVK